MLGLMGEYRENVKNFVVINLNYADRARISMTHVISPAINDTYPYPSCFFLNARVLGFCTRSSIVSWCMDPNIEVLEKSEDFSWHTVRPTTFHIFRLY
jgi:hypothetical protein